MHIYVYIYGLHPHFCLDYIMLDKSKEKRNCEMMFFFSRTYQIGAYKNNKSAKAALGVISVGLVTVLISSKRDGTILNASLFFKKNSCFEVLTKENHQKKGPTDPSRIPILSWCYCKMGSWEASQRK